MKLLETMNQGAQLLTVHIKAEGSQAKLAEKVGVNQGNLSRYASGAARPGLKTRWLFRDSCGIPLEAWDQSATSRPDDSPAENGDAA